MKRKCEEKPKFILNFFLLSFLRLNKNVCTPKLILQTDVEGLEKLKESKIKINEENLFSTNTQNSECDSIIFDLLEISEKITSV